VVDPQGEPRLQYGSQSLDLAQEFGDPVHLDIRAEGVTWVRRDGPN